MPPFRIILVAAAVTIGVILAATGGCQVHRGEVLARYRTFVSAMARDDTNACATLCVGPQSWSYLDAILAPRASAISEPFIVVWGSSASVWPRGGSHRGFPIGDRLDFRLIKGTWFVTGGQLD